MRSYIKKMVIISSMILTALGVFTACQDQGASSLDVSSSIGSDCHDKKSCKKLTDDLKNQIDEFERQLKSLPHDIETFKNLLRTQCTRMKEKGTGLGENKSACSKVGL